MLVERMDTFCHAMLMENFNQQPKDVDQMQIWISITLAQEVLMWLGNGCHLLQLMAMFVVLIPKYGGALHQDGQIHQKNALWFIAMELVKEEYLWTTFQVDLQHVDKMDLPCIAMVMVYSIQQINNAERI